ncbi:MAG TPA: hypothetical protein VFS60_07515, partial [Thermoanaerobaculia bacterium]|nr:hypothetical protein [Thermoanaerobaculia bacterium]
MIEKADWEAVYRELAATSRHRGRNRTGAASAAESAAEAAAADEAFLACHPEVARALLAPLEVPYQGRPGDPDYLTAAELEQNWAALQERLDEKGHAAVEGGEQSQVAGKPVIEHVPEAPLAPPRWQPQTAPPPLRGWQLAAAAAALVATVAVGLYWRAEQTAR